MSLAEDKRILRMHRMTKGKNMHKNVLAYAIAFLLAAGTGASAADEKDAVDNLAAKLGDFSAEVAITSDYSFRGISQTNKGPAIQGSFGWSKDFDVGGQKVTTFASAWASTRPRSLSACCRPSCPPRERARWRRP